MKRFLMWTVLVLPPSVYGQSTHVSELLHALQDPARADAASEELRGLAHGSVQSMKDTEDGLAGVLKVRSDAAIFKREADLARELKLASLAPVLAQRLDDEDSRDLRHRMGGFAQSNGPEFDPAMKALVSFGSVSIPPLVQELNEGNRAGRFRAAHALAAIGGPEVKAAFQDRYEKEPDAGLKQMLDYRTGLLLNGRR